MSLIMVNNKKICKQKSSLRSESRISWFCLAGLIYACGASIPTVVAVYLGYKILRVVMRVFAQVLSVIFSVIAIIVLILLLLIII